MDRDKEASIEDGKKQVRVYAAVHCKDIEYDSQTRLQGVLNEFGKDLQSYTDEKIRMHTIVRGLGQVAVSDQEQAVDCFDYNPTVDAMFARTTRTKTRAIIVDLPLSFDNGDNENAAVLKTKKAFDESIRSGAQKLINKKKDDSKKAKKNATRLASSAPPTPSETGDESVQGESRVKDVVQAAKKPTLEDLMKRMDKSEQKNDELSGEIGKLKDQNDELKEEVGKLKDQNAELKDRADKADERVGVLEKENTKLTRAVRVLENEKVELAQKVRDLDQKTNQQNIVYNELLQAHVRLKKFGGNVAFYKGYKEGSKGVDADPPTTDADEDLFPDIAEGKIPEKLISQYVGLRAIIDAGQSMLAQFLDLRTQDGEESYYSLTFRNILNFHYSTGAQLTDDER
ncbi:hypothetical protein D9613_006554 [Agrocybe pediades]|uniref:Uncharacterized protein n=1 Tax=Agrocybe pediades TaxID=84607 RepID=A0A8H4VHK5_9AGAR|nr:hypothetical protein D9613_006554 [Agrocybe pediades]